MEQDKKYYRNVIETIINAAHKTVENEKYSENKFLKKHLKRVVDMLNTALEIACIYELDEESKQFAFNQGDSINGLLDYYESKYRVFTKENGEFKLMKFV